MQPTTSEPAAASLLVLESGATFPFEATGYRRATDTAIVVQQVGESEASLRGRIRRAARQLLQEGVHLAAVALVIDQNSGQSHPERHSTALALIEQLPTDDAQLLLIADRAPRELRHQLIGMVGALIERDRVKHSVAIDFDARHVADLRAAGALGTLGRAEVSRAHAC